MLERNYNVQDPLKVLTEHLNSIDNGYRTFRRRAIILQSNKLNSIFACSIEAIPNSNSYSETLQSESSKQYSKTSLFEDFLTSSELVRFMDNVVSGQIKLGEYTIDASNPHRQWSSQRVPLSNRSMSCAGYVWESKFSSSNSTNEEHQPLISPDLPYYPDIYEAAKHWLPFPEYDGQNDSSKGKIILLLPETRAFFTVATHTENCIALQIAGTQLEKLTLCVIGAWWNDSGIHHFQVEVSENQALLDIPATAYRIEYILSDLAGNIYDFQSEDKYRHTGLGRNNINRKQSTLENIIKEACRNGEGSQIEFKEYIDPEHSKMNEIMRTVAAFANTNGGRIFIGINDECGLTGIENGLSKLHKAPADDSACEQYLGALRGKIRDSVRGDPILHFKHAAVDGKFIAIIEVEAAQNKPITIHQNTNLYLRRGSSNSKVPPDEWKSILYSTDPFTTFRG